jgi:hypothetical protein
MRDYILTEMKDDQPVGRRTFSAESDDAAIDQADQIGGGGELVLCQGERVVARFPSAAFRPTS